MRYPEYIQRTTNEERSLYSLYYALKGLKEEHAMERAKLQAELEREAERTTSRNGFRH